MPWSAGNWEIPDTWRLFVVFGGLTAASRAHRGEGWLYPSAGVRTNCKQGLCSWLDVPKLGCIGYNCFLIYFFFPDRLTSETWKPNSELKSSCPFFCRSREKWRCYWTPSIFLQGECFCHLAAAPSHRLETLLHSSVPAKANQAACVSTCCKRRCSIKTRNSYCLNNSIILLLDT